MCFISTWVLVRNSKAKATEDVSHQVNGARRESLCRCCLILAGASWNVATCCLWWHTVAALVIQDRSQQHYSSPLGTLIHLLLLHVTTRQSWPARSNVPQPSTKVPCWEIKHAASQSGHPSVQLRHVRSSPAAAAAAVFTLTLCVSCFPFFLTCSCFAHTAEDWWSKPAGN